MAAEAARVAARPGRATAGGITRDDLDGMTKTAEERLTKFAASEVPKLQDRLGGGGGGRGGGGGEGGGGSQNLPRRMGWNARQEDTGV